MKISGTFKVDLAPLDAFEKGKNNIQISRMSINKTFSGSLAACSKGEMLSAVSPVKGSAGYVAIEQVEGTLDGKEGSFVLQHFGSMGSGTQRLILEVVPDSGTGQLEGLRGSMEITIKEGQHFYTFNYTLEHLS